VLGLALTGLGVWEVLHADRIRWQDRVIWRRRSAPKWGNALRGLVLVGAGAWMFLAAAIGDVR
jgi:hypothetical protein